MLLVMHVVDVSFPHLIAQVIGRLLDSIINRLLSVIFYLLNTIDLPYMLYR